MAIPWAEQSRYTRQEGKSTPKETGTIYDEIRKHLHFKGVEKLMLGVGDCRTGTTAWLAAASRIDFPAYYQPAKAIMRCLMADQEPEDIYFTKKRRKIVVAKETIGPHNPIECTLNPLDLYLSDGKSHNGDNRGLSPEQLHVVFFLRNPVAILKSWQKAFSEDNKVNPIDPKTLLSNFVLAARTEMLIYKQLQEQEISHTVYVQELLQDLDGRGDFHEPYILQRIFSNAGIPLSPTQAVYATTGWQEQGAPGLKKRIKFPYEPPYNAEGTTDRILNSTRYQFVGQPATLADMTSYELTAFQSAGLIKFYNQLLPVSADHLGVYNFSHLSLV